MKLVGPRIPVKETLGYLNKEFKTHLSNHVNHVCSLNSETLLQKLQKVSQYRKYATLKAGNKFFSALVDSGNLGLNVISYDLARSLNLNVRQFARKPKLTTAKEGEQMEVVGFCEPFSFSFAGHGTNFKSNPIVVEGLTFGFVIGLPFLASNGIDQIHSEGALKIQGRLVPLEQNEVFERQQCTRDPLKQAYREKATLFLAQNVTVPANTMVYIPLHVACLSELTFPEEGPCEGLVSPDPRFEEQQDIHPAKRALSRVDEKGNVWSVLYNSQEEPMRFSKGLKFGTFTPVYGENSACFTRIPFSLCALEFSNNSSSNEGAADNRPHQDEVSNGCESNTRKARRQWVKRVFKLQNNPLLTGERLELATNLLTDFYSLFAQDGLPGETDLVHHEINLKPGSAPIRVKQRPLNPIMEESLRKQVNEWIGAGVVEPSQSPWRFPLIPVKKKGSPGSIRWCVDFRSLNAQTITDAYCIPDVQSNLARLANSNFFSVIDTVCAFHHVKLRASDKKYCAFQAPQGLYQFCKMPFGLKNAPSTFSRLVSKALGEVPLECVLVFLDDCLIHSQTFEEHLCHVRLALRAHEKAGLKIKPEKCKFFQNEVEYLGHLVSPSGVRVIPEYIRVIQEWPVPETTSDVRAFLGKCGYYRRFIGHFGSIANPLSELLKDKKKNEKIEMTEEAMTAFEALKKELSSAPVLAFPRFDGSPFILDTDYSQAGMGAVLSQLDDEGNERPIAYASRKLTQGERSYGPTKGELAAGVTFMQQFRFYLLHQRFTWRTDHRALTWHVHQGSCGTRRKVWTE